jgi:hypothetical protein
MTAANLDPMSIQVCPVTDRGCEAWTVACGDPTNPVDYSIMRDLQNPMNEEVAIEVGKLCWDGNGTCGVDAMAKLKTELYERGKL